MFKIKRIYEEATPDDGTRILVDRLWPRGVSKEKAALDEWNKDVAPSTELRKWFDHDPEKFAEFSARYIYELEHDREKITAVNHLKEANKKSMVTLLYGAKDPEVNHALVLMNYLNSD